MLDKSGLTVSSDFEGLENTDEDVVFELIDKKEIEVNDVANLRSISYTSANIDHLYTTSNSSSLSHDGRVYTQEAQEFNLMPYDLGNTTKALYRYCSSTSNNHLLSTSSSVVSFTKEEMIGYIFTEQQVGTVPLLEYYSS